MKNKSLVLLAFLAFSLFARTRIAVFPFKAATDDPLLAWVGYAAAELFYDKLSRLSNIQVWEPAFLFQIDSSAWTLNSDSVARAHAKRWKWDYAVGGMFRASDDSVWLRLRSVKPMKDKLAKKEWKAKGLLTSQRELCARLIFNFLVSTGYEFTEEETAVLKAEGKIGHNAYATYARGLGYEMHGNIAGALSAYEYAAHFDKRFAAAFRRQARLYRASRTREQARDALQKALDIEPESPAIVADMATYLAEFEKPEKADDFVGKNRKILSSTAAGMSAIGLNFISHGEYQRAIAILTRAVAAGPSDLSTDFALGRAYLLSGQFSQASDVFRRLIEFRPQHVRYYSLLGSAYRQAGKYMESSNVLELALRLAPRDVPNLINLSTTYYKIGWHKKAEQVLLKAKEINPDIGAIYLNLGVIYWHMGRKSDARAMFNKASQHGSSVQAAFNNEANILLLGGDIKNAIKAYRRADKAGKKSEIILFNLGHAYLKTGKLKDAALCFDEVLLLSPMRLDVLVERAGIAEKLGQEDDAEQYYRKIVGLDAQNKKALIRLIELLTKNERYEEAAEFIKGALDNFPGDYDLRLSLPNVYAKMDWHEVAIMEYEKLIVEKDYMNDPRCYLGLGKSYYELIVTKNARHYDKTIQYLKRVIQLSPKNAEADIMLADIYMTYKNYPSLALEHLRAAMSKANDAATRRKIREMMTEAQQ